MKKTAAPSPEDGDLGAKLDRIIELLEQRTTTYPVPYYVPRPYTPYVPFQGPYWWNGGTATSPAITYTTYNSTTSK